eukprot:PhF_6_TR14751/c0_g1_i1/m.23162
MAKVVEAIGNCRRALSLLVIRGHMPSNRVLDLLASNGVAATALNLNIEDQCDVDGFVFASGNGFSGDFSRTITILQTLQFESLHFGPTSPAARDGASGVQYAFQSIINVTPPQGH